MLTERGDFAARKLDKRETEALFQIDRHLVMHRNNTVIRGTRVRLISRLFCQPGFCCLLAAIAKLGPIRVHGVPRIDTCSNTCIYDIKALFPFRIGGPAFAQVFSTFLPVIFRFAMPPSRNFISKLLLLYALIISDQHEAGYRDR